jgi:parallel beta-helix repeat protein
MEKIQLLPFFLWIAWIALPLSTLAQGNLTPPGPPAPSMKSLGQIEPRTPIGALPYSISNSGSYYLTTNLTGTAGIQILTNNVSLDLEGFTLTGNGSGYGIEIFNETNIVVCNGNMVQWYIGLYAAGAYSCRFEHLICSQDAEGISAGSLAIASECMASGNSLDGMDFEGGSRIINCSARYNGGYGINAGTEANVTGCVADYNGQDGIFLDRGMVKDCLAENNKCLNNKLAGVASDEGGNRFDGNDVTGNGFGIQAGNTTGNLIIRNTATQNGTNYNVEAGNTEGPVVTSGGIGSVVNPYANLSY